MPLAAPRILLEFLLPFWYEMMLRVALDGAPSGLPIEKSRKLTLVGGGIRLFAGDSVLFNLWSG